MYYPNSFSPNGDFIDDYWYPCGVNISQDNYSLKIYNNDERLLFKTDNINKNRWDGIVDGEKCPVGYYYYVVKYQDLSGHKLKNSGMFQLIR